MQINEWVKIIFDSLYDGVLITDENSIVKYVNSAYTRITGVQYKDIIDMKLDDIRPGSQLPVAVKTGQKLLGVRRMVGDTEYIVNMVPIIENDRIVGGISLLNEINDIYKLTEELEKSNRIIRNLKDQVKQIKGTKYSFEDIICSDKQSLDTIHLAKRIAVKDMNVLITGESGTGKELFAQSIHQESKRKLQPFVAINCATLEDNLLESELFGYTDGSFTGAKKGGKMGLFEKANGGTLFLDEISEMDYRLQAKILRTLQEGVIRPVGALTEQPIDVRVIAATNKNLELMIEDNEFRKDLFYRLSIFSINLLPLRERPEDIPCLVKNFMNEISLKYKTAMEISDDALALLCNYAWPGNVRELKNVIEYGAMMCDNNLITIENLPKRIEEEGLRNDLVQIKSLASVARETELNEIRKALIKYGDTVDGKKKVAKSLGISLASLYNKLKNIPEQS